MRKLRSKGFTLIELLVVIAIIGILAVFTLAFLQPARAKGRDSKRKSDVNAIVKAAELYYSDNSAYPTLPADVANTNTLCGSNVTAMTELTAGADPYLAAYPSAPNAGETYRACNTTPSGVQGLLVVAILENGQDAQRRTVGAEANTFQYCLGETAAEGLAADCSNL